jgi:hypothetical protein
MDEGPSRLPFLESRQRSPEGKRVSVILNKNDIRPRNFPAQDLESAGTRRYKWPRTRSKRSVWQFGIGDRIFVIARNHTAFKPAGH